MFFACGRSVPYANFDWLPPQSRFECAVGASQRSAAAAATDVDRPKRDCAAADDAADADDDDADEAFVDADDVVDDVDASSSPLS